MLQFRKTKAMFGMKYWHTTHTIFSVMYTKLHMEYPDDLPKSAVYNRAHCVISHNAMDFMSFLPYYVDWTFKSWYFCITVYFKLANMVWNVYCCTLQTVSHSLLLNTYFFFIKYWVVSSKQYAGIPFLQGKDIKRHVQQIDYDKRWHTMRWRHGLWED